MQNRLVFWAIFLLIIAAEAYGFVAVRTALNLTSLAARRGFALSYWALTLGLWALCFWAAATRHDGAIELKSYLLGVPLVLLAAKLIVVFPMLFEDLTRLARWAARGFASDAAAGPGATPLTRSQFISRLALGLGAVPLLALIWGMVKGKTDYQVRRVVLRYPNLPASFDGFKILQISDLHTGSFNGNTEPMRRAVAIINAQKADLIVMTGDLVNDRAPEVEPHIEALAGIVSELPIFSILGNHDYGDYVQWPSPEAKRENLQRLARNHAKIGWRLLLDESHTIRRGTDELAVLGVQNWSAHRNFPKHGNLARAHAASGQAPFKLLLSHDPSHWEAQVLDYQDVDLTLSGHTHGMQFGVNLPGLKWSPVQYSYPQWAGLYEQGRQKLYVNVGLGYLGFPGRVGFLPEITLLELRRA
ncbi:metallophosphoesterase [Hymenobacter sp. H14-R3]|uniref:metallophosphoesterase n=1 Tax=Hymenobacter sp. H14-R3 TaxID=3046308 RepID=UPI0024BAAC97|nr:metallophosphoesterase [Hymenobacter sp. H14-R3]MDJ0365592.1 metallophosphoesterase [Hymenobacter sp. H14-R3]